MGSNQSQVDSLFGVLGKDLRIIEMNSSVTRIEGMCQNATLRVTHLYRKILNLGLGIEFRLLPGPVSEVALLV